METIYNKKGAIDLASTLNTMNVGDILDVPDHLTNSSFRSQVCLYGKATHKVFSTKKDEAHKVLKIFRLS